MRGRQVPRRASVALGVALAVVLAAALLPAVAPSAALAQTFATRLAGADRFGTAVRISQEQFRDGAEEVYLARADVFADAVSGGSLTRGPILLVPGDGRVPETVLTEVARLGPQQVIALGGEVAISDAVLDTVAGDLRSLRLTGSNRFDTAVEIARRQFPERAPIVYLARADVFADAVAAGALEGGPILLVPSTGDLPDVVGDELLRLAPGQVVALGDQTAVADRVLEDAAAAAQRGLDALPDDVTVALAEVRAGRLAGLSRIDTAVAIAGAFAQGAPRAFLARADSFPDAVAGGTLTGGPVLLVPTCGELPEQVGVALARLGARQVTALGGEQAICDDLLQAAGAALVGPDLDSDQDGITDAIELRFGSDPEQADSDGDGLSDAFEIRLGGAEHVPDDLDSDGDRVADGTEDVDGDGLTAAQEEADGTYPLTPDTDRDGLDDGGEREARSDPLVPDTDGDGLDDRAEVEGGTSPIRGDSDGDGTRDDREIRTATVAAPHVTVALTGTGDLAARLTSFPVPPGDDAVPAGLVSTPVQLALDIDSSSSSDGELVEAAITLPYDEDAVTDPADLGVFRFDERYQTWTPTGRDLTATDGAVTATVDGFSTYAVFDASAWAEPWQNAEPSCATRLGASAVPATDLALVLDGSGSMADNDPQGLRRNGAKLLNDSLLAEDRRLVVEFDGSAQVLQPLTTDARAVAAAIDRVGQDGATDLTEALSTSIDALVAGRQAGRGQVLVLLTDGVNDPPQPDADTVAQAQRAADAGIRVFTIGLGDAPFDGLLTAVAGAADGIYRTTPDAGDLPQAFRTVDKATVGLPDADGDGLADCEETAGMPEATGTRVYTSDPTQEDSDGDGLSDFVEIGEGYPISDPAVVAAVDPALRTSGFRYPVISNPLVADSDGDGLDDAGELDEGTRALNSDTDGDGLDDVTELELQTDPTDTDTDGDGDEFGFGLDDTYEHLNRDDGLDALEPDVIFTREQYLADYTTGIVCGDFCQLDSIPATLGAIIGGSVPVVGTVGDVRDVTAGVINGDFVGASLAGVGVIPVVGDSLKGADTIVSFARRNPGQASALLVAVFRRVSGGEAAKAALVRQIYGDELDVLRTLKTSPASFADVIDTTYLISDRNVLRLIDGRTSIPRLAEAARRVERPGGVSDFLPNGGAGEAALRLEVSARGGRPSAGPVGLANPLDPDSRRNFRLVDVLDDGAATAFESKVGYTSASSRIREQIRRDRALLTSGNVRSVEWHFYPSDLTGKVGPSEPLMDLLDQAPRIPFVIHLPPG